MSYGLFSLEEVGGVTGLPERFACVPSLTSSLRVVGTGVNYLVSVKHFEVDKC